MTRKKPSVLIVEDDGLIALHLQELLLDSGYDIPDPVASGEEAIEYVRTSPPPDLILMDITLDGKLNGIETARQIRKVSMIPIVFLSAHSDMNPVAEEYRGAPTGFIAKPFTRDNVISTIDKILQR